HLNVLHLRVNPENQPTSFIHLAAVYLYTAILWRIHRSSYAFDLECTGGLSVTYDAASASLTLGPFTHTHVTFIQFCLLTTLLSASLCSESNDDTVEPIHAMFMYHRHTDPHRSG